MVIIVKHSAQKFFEYVLLKILPLKSSAFTRNAKYYSTDNNKGVGI